MTAAKIRLLFAVFSVCFVILYFRSVSSCSASSSDDCTKLAGESHPDSYLGFMYHLKVAPYSFRTARELISKISRWREL